MRQKSKTFQSFRSGLKNLFSLVASMARQTGPNMRAIFRRALRDSRESVVEDGAEDGYREMREMRRVVIELKVADDTVIGEIFGDAGFGDA